MSKDHSTRGQGILEFCAVEQEIRELFFQGYSVRAIYNRFKSEGRLTINERWFRKIIAKRLKSSGALHSVPPSHQDSSDSSISPPPDSRPNSESCAPASASFILKSVNLDEECIFFDEEMKNG